MHMPTLSLRHWSRRPSPVAPATVPRHTVRPPSLCHAPDSRWARLMHWVLAPAAGDSAPPIATLPAVRADFHRAVADLVQAEEAGELVRRIEHSRSLRELWHLRTEVYRLVALQHSQGEADARLARLNRHFPTRAPRSGFMPL
jgi:hypothetical protein